MPRPFEIAASEVSGLNVGETSPSSILTLDPLAVSNWDDQVKGLSGYSFFHSASWARTLEDSYGYKPVYFAEMQGRKIRNLLPMMEVNSWLTGRRGVSLPFTDSCEALGAGTQALFDAATRMGQERGWRYWEARGSCGQPDTTPGYTTFLTHGIQVSGNEDAIFNRFESSVRRAIRKGQNAGVSVDISQSMDDMRSFYRLHCQTRQKHGVPPQPFAFFESLHRHVVAHNLGFVVIARFQGRPISAGVFVHFGNKAIYKYGASEESFSHLRGANLVMWHAIQWYARAGFERFDFGRTAKSNEGLRRFKLGWGAVEQPSRYYRFDFKNHCFVTGPDEAEGLSHRIFRRTPQPISRFIGRVLYRHVA